MRIRFDSRVQCTLSVLIIGLLVVRFVLPANADDTIRISISNTGGAFSVAGIALKKGFFEKEHEKGISQRATSKQNVAPGFHPAGAV